MIVTLTPNPSLDRTVEVGELTRGAVLRVRSSHVEPGGKGVNIARALARHGVRTTAVLPSGGPEGAQLETLLLGEGIEPVLVPVHGTVRSNISLVEPGGTVTKLNEPGPTLSPVEVKALETAAAEVAEHATWLALSGSLPPGVPDDFYADLIDDLRGREVRVAVDTSGVPLTASLIARPDVIKPNLEELAEVTGREIVTLGDAVAAAELLRTHGAVAVLVSLGPDGAVLVDADGAVHGEAPVPVRRSTVGAGDALLAGFLSASSGLSAGGIGATARAEALAEALAWGAAAICLPGSQMPGPYDLDRTAVRISPYVDSGRALTRQDAP
jgi:1-phosphofructokinase